MTGDIFRKARILVVDDDSPVADLIARILQERGCEGVEVVVDPREAVERWRETAPDLVILDLLMPHVSGLELLKKFRDSPTQKMPVLVLTSDPRPESRHAALAAGANDFLNKPFDTTEIVLRVSNLLETHFLHLQLQKEHEKLHQINAEQVRAAESLRISEERLHRFLDHAPWPAFIKDLHGRYSVVNRQCGKVLNVSPQEILGKTNYDLFSKEIADLLYRNDCEVLEHGPQDFHEIIPQPDGIHDYVTVKFPLLDLKGSIDAIGGISTDVTDRNRAEEALRTSEERFRILYDENPLMLMMVDPSGIVRSINQFGARHLGYAPLEICSKPIQKLLHEEDQQASLAQVTSCLQGEEGVNAIEVRKVHKNGQILWARETARKVSWGEEELALVVCEDITLQREASEALKEAKEEAERANRAKSEFLSRMSHELRTPLNAVIGFGQVLEMGQLSGQEGQCVHQILKAGRHLLDLVNEVLDLSGIEAGRLTLSLETINVFETVAETIDLIRPLAVQRNLKMDIQNESENGEWIFADRQRLKQVLLNLLANAVKYNHEGGSINLSWGEVSPDRLRIIVRDTGPGVEAEKLPRLFAPFERLGADRTGVEGNGLGLALSKRLIEAMGGEIGAESSVGKGSTFWIELPSMPNPMARLKEPATSEPSSSRSRGTLLYIEDNVSNLKLIEHLLGHRPAVKLLVAMQGRIGLDLAREHRPDLVLLDLHLPDIMGDEVLRQIRGEPDLHDLPVIILSAHATPSERQRLLDAGATAYLAKPIDLRKFLEAIDELLPRHRPE